MTINVLFVCMGNICRSPTAEGVFRKLVAEQGLADQFTIDSAGTHGYHIGDPPDHRAQVTAARRGYDLSTLRARQVTRADFEQFDYVLAMDEGNLDILLRACPASLIPRVRLFLDFAEGIEEREVPDPYYGGPDGFEHVLDLVETAGERLLQRLLKR